MSESKPEIDPWWCSSLIMKMADGIIFIIFKDLFLRCPNWALLSFSLNLNNDINI